VLREIDNRTRLVELKSQNDQALNEVFEGVREVAFLGFPAHENVGDSMIALGAFDYFAGHDIAVRYLGAGMSADLEWLREWSRRSGTAVVHIGGGNFGTLWPGEHAFRLATIAALPDARIIQLPQSLHFSDERRSEETRATVSRHSNYSLLVRDRQSLSVAQKFGVPATLAPDMAFRLPMLKRHESEVDVLVLSRGDREARGKQLEGIETPNVRVTDWVRSHRPERALNRLVCKLDGRRAMTGTLAAYLAGHRLRRGNRVLSAGKVVVTDRLHVHILCLLLGIPHALADSIDGKVFALRDAWTASMDGVALITEDQPVQAAIESLGLI